MVDARIKITKQDRADFEEKGIGLIYHRVYEGRDQIITFHSSSITKLLKGRKDKFPLVSRFHKDYGISSVFITRLKEWLFSSKLVISADDGAVEFQTLKLSDSYWIGYGIHFNRPSLYICCTDPIIKIKTGLLCAEMNLLYDEFNKVILDTLVEKGKISFLEDNKLTLGTKCTTTAQNWKK